MYKSKISGAVVQDEAHRTTKVLEYTLDVEAFVTLESAGVPGQAQNEATIDPTMTNLRKLLTQHAGTLTFAGKGFGFFVVNPVGGQFNNKPAPVVLTDAAWGPVPKLLDFKPLGASRGALVHWQCVVRIPETVTQQRTIVTGVIGPVLQFNWGYELTYDDEGYSSYSIKGTLEIPLTRTTAAARDVTQTVDDFRKAWLDLDTDLTKFRVTRRHFGYSRDKRTVEWEFSCEELPPMGLPPGCTKATGTASVRNTGGPRGGGRGTLTFNFWTVSLRATYTVRADQPQRVAWEAFLALLWYRMHASANGIVPKLSDPKEPKPPDPTAAARTLAMGGLGGAALLAAGNTLDIYAQLFRSAKPPPAATKKPRSIILTQFGFDEGLYLDSKQITFHASWWLATTWQSLFAATGVWKWLDGSAGGNAWAASVKDIMGSQSWRENRLNPKADVIVDFGGGGPPGDLIVQN